MRLPQPEQTKELVGNQKCSMDFQSEVRQWNRRTDAAVRHHYPLFLLLVSSPRT